jgi:RND family efflux transporter MFP subunit
MFLYVPGVLAQGPPGPPPAQVAVSGVKKGLIAPQSEFIGTVYYKEVSDVAAEVRGMVKEVTFEEGDRIEGGKLLVQLDSEVLEKTIDATRASHDEVLADLEMAKIELRRVESLFTEEVISEQAYDEARFKVKGLIKRADSLKAELGGLDVELRKKSIKAPFAGVVIEKHVDRGEWLEPGTVVATLASVDYVDIIVDVPERVMKAVKVGMTVSVMAAGKRLKGKLFAIVPRGDIKTRTFPVKIRVKNTANLAESMEARVVLPTGTRKKALIVPRDALITAFGQTVVFAVVDSKAKMVPVKVIGYKGKTVGVESAQLSEGMKVVIKGNERLQDGQQVIVPGSK